MCLCVCDCDCMSVYVYLSQLVLLMFITFMTERQNELLESCAPNYIPVVLRPDTCKTSFFFANSNNFARMAK